MELSGVPIRQSKNPLSEPTENFRKAGELSHTRIKGDNDPEKEFHSCSRRLKKEFAKRRGTIFSSSGKQGPSNRGGLREDVEGGVSKKRQLTLISQDSFTFPDDEDRP